MNYNFFLSAVQIPLVNMPWLMQMKGQTESKALFRTTLIRCHMKLVRLINQKEFMIDVKVHLHTLIRDINFLLQHKKESLPQKMFESLIEFQ